MARSTWRMRAGVKLLFAARAPELQRFQNVIHADLVSVPETIDEVRVVDLYGGVVERVGGIGL